MKLNKYDDTFTATATTKVSVVPVVCKIYQQQQQQQQYPAGIDDGDSSVWFHPLFIIIIITFGAMAAATATSVTTVYILFNVDYKIYASDRPQGQSGCTADRRGEE